jgi:hypothetical protein
MADCTQEVYVDYGEPHDGMPALWGTHERYFTHLYIDVRRSARAFHIDTSTNAFAKWSFHEQTNDSHPDDLDVIVNVTIEQITALRQRTGSVLVPALGDRESFRISECSDAGFVRPIVGRGLSSRGTLYVSLNTTN